MIQKLKSKDREAFYELVALYKKSVVATCYKFLLNHEDAEDLSQDVFIEIYESIGSFREESQLSTWIYRITITKCLDELKRRKRKKRFGLVIKFLHIEDVADRISGGALTDSSLHEAEMWKEISLVLDTLPENQRIAYTLSKLEGFSNKEIAHIMNITIIAVESLVYRAKKRVMGQLVILLKKRG